MVQPTSDFVPDAAWRLIQLSQSIRYHNKMIDALLGARDEDGEPPADHGEAIDVDADDFFYHTERLAVLEREKVTLAGPEYAI